MDVKGAFSEIYEDLDLLVIGYLIVFSARNFSWAQKQIYRTSLYFRNSNTIVGIVIYDKSIQFKISELYENERSITAN